MVTSVIITTYNRPDALECVLNAFAAQDCSDFEVIVADDGSTAATKALLDKLRPSLNYTVHHVWQEDEGFQAAKIRNKAAAIASFQYLIFVDGDCLPFPSFIRRHLSLAEKGTFVAGNRLLLSQPFTKEVIANKQPIYRWSFIHWFLPRIQGKCNRLLPLVNLPFQRWRKGKKQRWKGVKTCNLAIWKEDFVAVNGMDESFTGWGYEDSDLVIRILRSGIKRKSGKFSVPVIHLWHPENDRSREEENIKKLKEIETGNRIEAKLGVNQYQEQHP